MLRLTTANGIRAPHRLYNRLRPLEPERSRLGLRFGGDALSALTGWSEDVLNLLGHECSATGRARIRTPKGPVKLDATDVRPIFTPMHCPDCAEEDGYIDVSWCLANIQICTRHRKEGVETCSSCGMSFSWDRPSLSRCGCGHPIQSANSIELCDERIACTELIQHLVHPQLRAPETARGLGFPVDELLRLDLKQMTRLVHDLAKLLRLAEGRVGVDQRTDCECAGMLLREWPKPFEDSLRRVTAKLPHDEAATYLFSRDGSLLTRQRRQLGADGGVFEFLTQPMLAFLESSPLRPAVDKRVWTRLGIRKETNWAGVSHAARATGIDRRAIQQLVSKGIIQSRSMGQGRIAVDSEEISRDVVRAWKTIGGREAAAAIGLPVKTFKQCLGEGLFEIPLLQSRRRGYSRAGVLQIRDQLNEAAAHARIAERTKQPSYTVREIMKSSLFATRTKVDLVKALLDRRLQVITRRNRGFLDLRVEGVTRLSRVPRRAKGPANGGASDKAQSNIVVHSDMSRIA